MKKEKGLLEKSPDLMLFEKLFFVANIKIKTFLETSKTNLRQSVKFLFWKSDFRNIIYVFSFPFHIFYAPATGGGFLFFKNPRRSGGSERTRPTPVARKETALAFELIYHFPF